MKASGCIFILLMASCGTDRVIDSKPTKGMTHQYNKWDDFAGDRKIGSGEERG